MKALDREYRLHHTFNSGDGPILMVKWIASVKKSGEQRQLQLCFSHAWVGSGSAGASEIKTLIGHLSGHGFTEASEYIHVVVA